MFADLFLAVDVSDDDVELAEVASQCGYDFCHPLVGDVAEPVVAEWHGEACFPVVKLPAPSITPVRFAAEYPAPGKTPHWGEKAATSHC